MGEDREQVPVISAMSVVTDFSKKESSSPPNKSSPFSIPIINIEQDEQDMNYLTVT